MHIVKIEQNLNGSHDDQLGVGIGIPEGWAIVPEEMQLPETYPFVNIEVEESDETFVNESHEKISVYVVTSMTAGKVPEPTPEPEPVEPKPTQLDMIEAQVTYTAMMTDTLLEV